MLKIALVGVGYWSREMHGPALARYAQEHPGEVELAAVCVRKSVEKAQEYCAEFGFGRVYTDLGEMIETEQPSACIVVAPIAGTRAVVGEVMERGVAVLFEKPPGKDLREAKELADLSRRTGVPNMVAFNRRWAPCTRKALNWGRQHGPFEYLQARMLRSKRMDDAFAFGTGIHLLDCVRALSEATMGGLESARVNRVESEAGRFNFHVDLAFGSGATGRCDILPTCGVIDETYTLFGNNRWISYSLPWHTVDGKAELWVEGELTDSESWPAQPAFLNSGVYGEVVEFLAALKEGRKPAPSAEEAVQSVALAESVQEGVDIEFG